MAESRVLLVDNGSLAAAATLRLRTIAAALAARIGRPVDPVSLLHSSGVPAHELASVPAEILVPAIARRAAGGTREFLVVPLFFGPSAALTEFLPASIAQLRGKFPDLLVRAAPPLFADGDDRLARILADHVRAAASTEARPPQPVALVDHGSPARAVTAVRDQLAGQLGELLGPDFSVAPASMERREGPEFDFAEPLLSSLLQRPGWNAGAVIVALQFVLPGRHAGPGGDVETICREAEAGGGLRTRPTALVGDHPLLLEILADRWRTGAAARPI